MSTPFIVPPVVADPFETSAIKLVVIAMTLEVASESAFAKSIVALFPDAPV